VSLQGTFDVVALADLMRMLASGRKNGELVIESGGVAARIEFQDGACSGAESTDARGALADEAELHRRAVDVCFSVARYPGGSFRFAPNDSGGPTRDVTIAVEPLLAELELLKAEWDEICEVVPAITLRPALAEKLSGSEITVSSIEWALLARLDGYTSVADLVDPQRETLVEVCRAVAELVRRGAIELREPTTELAHRTETSADAQSASTEYFAPRIVPVAPYGPGVEASALEPSPDLSPVAEAEPISSDSAAETAPAAELEEATDPRDRGAILRLFSGLREA
jgi:Domain of unknown function (DUF4388)